MGRTASCKNHKLSMLRDCKGKETVCACHQQQDTLAFKSLGSVQFFFSKKIILFIKDSNHTNWKNQFQSCLKEDIRLEKVIRGLPAITESQTRKFKSSCCSVFFPPSSD